jgi:hypothetical protein
VKEATPAEIAALLRDPACPASNSGGSRVVSIPHFLLFAKQRDFATTDLEQRTDERVETLGGSREPLIDPWRLLPNLARRLLRRSSLPREFVWVLPDETTASSCPEVP